MEQDPHHFIGAKINRLSHILRQDLSNHTAALELTASQSFLIGYLVHHRDQPIFQRDLEHHFKITHATASGLLQRLEKKGFVQFRTGEKDRRCKQIVVMEKAVACHEETVRHLLASNSRLVDGMSDAEVAELHRLLDLAIANMESPAGATTKTSEEECT